MSKTFSFLVVILFIFSTVSCLTDEEKEERTYEVEQAELSDFIDLLIEEGYDVDTTDLGVYYIENEVGTGLTPQEGDTVSVEYIGSFLNGAIFDASADHWIDGIWEFVYIEQPIITGFNNALSVMKEGGEVDAIFPSIYGYGITGTGVIPPYTSLIFNIKLHDVKPKTD